MIPHYQKLFAYNAWANREALNSLERMAPPPAKALRYFAHIIAAEQLWHTRLQNLSTQGFAVWPGWKLTECASNLSNMNHLWEVHLKSLTEEKLLRTLSYTNTKGEEWRNTAGDILTHVIIHSGYHRGQMAADVRASGGEPAYTDYIHAVRQGLLDDANASAHRHER